MGTPVSGEGTLPSLPARRPMPGAQAGLPARRPSSIRTPRQPGLVPPYEGATSRGPARRQVAIVEGKVSPAKTPQVRRAGIRQATPDGRL